MKTNRVLIVEDDGRAAALMRRELADLSPNLEVETASSGEEALRLIEQKPWDLVVTDNRMPGITGLELIERLKGKTPSTLTILITAFGSDEIEQAAQRLDVFQYMIKPFPLQDLERVIKDALDMEKDGGEETSVDAHLARRAMPQSLQVGIGEPLDSSVSRDDVPTEVAAKDERFAMKVTLGGDGGVGKTTLIRRLCTGNFETTRWMTIGVDFHVYDLQHMPSAARLIVWDVSGQERFAFTRRAFYRGSKAVGLVYAVNDRLSFERLPKWRDEIRQVLPRVSLVLAGNKVDTERRVTLEEGLALAKAWDVPFFETSCVSGYGVQDFFSTLADQAVQHVNAPDRVIIGSAHRRRT